MIEVLFARSDFRALNPDHAQLPAPDVPERVGIRDKLLALDEGISSPPFPETEILGLDLHRHWSQTHRTALWYPHSFNGDRVDEIYLRYGKSRAQVRALATTLIPPPDDGEPADLDGFPAHGHLAVGLAADAFFYQFVVGPRAWLDLNHMKEKLRSADAAALFGAIQCLGARGYLLIWGKNRLRIDSLASSQELMRFMDGLQDRAGLDWLLIRKNVYPDGNGCLTVSSDEIVEELRSLFAVFDFAVRRS